MTSRVRAYAALHGVSLLATVGFLVCGFQSGYITPNFESRTFADITAAKLSAGGTGVLWFAAIGLFFATLLAATFILTARELVMDMPDTGARARDCVDPAATTEKYKH